MILREFESTLEMNNIKFSADITIEVYDERNSDKSNISNIFVLARAMGLSGHAAFERDGVIHLEEIEPLISEHGLVEEALDELANNIRTAANALRPFAADEE